MAIFKERFSNAGDFTYIMVGNFVESEIIALLEKFVGGLPSHKGKEKWKTLLLNFLKASLR
jgi:zinc protease